MNSTSEKVTDSRENYLGRYPRIDPLGSVHDAMQHTKDPDDRTNLATLVANLEHDIIGDTEKTYLDCLAVALFSGSKLPQDSEEITDRLSIVSAALSGDAKAKEYLDDELTKRNQAEIEQQTLLTNEVLELASHHVLVHRTNYPPTVSSDGVVTLQSTAEATHGDEPRHTVHFAVDQAAVNPFGMQYGTKYTIVAPLDAALQANPHPAGFKGVDTFFASGPGEVITLPGAVVLQDADPDTIKKTIANYGAEPAVSDGQSVYSSVDNEVKAIANLLGYSPSLHIDTIHSTIEDKALLMQRALADDVDTNALFTNLAKADPATQRQYILRGLVPIPTPYKPSIYEDSGV